MFLAVLVVAGPGLGAAMAQEDLNRGKSPAQLFASDCADCHRNPRALKRQNAGALADFLRVHYTASRENAAAIAGYLMALGPAPRGGSTRPAEPGRARPAAGQDAGKPAVATPSAEKPAEPAPPKPPEPVPPAPAGEPAPATPPAHPQ